MNETSLRSIGKRSPRQVTEQTEQSGQPCRLRRRSRPQQVGDNRMRGRARSTCGSRGRTWHGGGGRWPPAGGRGRRRQLTRVRRPTWCQVVARTYLNGGRRLEGGEDRCDTGAPAGRWCRQLPEVPPGLLTRHSGLNRSPTAAAPGRRSRRRPSPPAETTSPAQRGRSALHDDSPGRRAVGRRDHPSDEER